jgi:hypothetical protein
MWMHAARLCLPIVFTGAVMLGALADEPPPPIRTFDIPTIERLGQQMYAQDQEAWKATDTLFLRHPMEELRKSKLHGWITETRDGHDVVRFIHDTDRGPEAFYDVTFSDGALPFLSVPENSKLTAPENVQYRARLLALANTQLRCAQRYNSIVLKDPKGDGWLVWVLASTEDADALIIGGHTRFTISTDGSTIVRRDALSRDCIQFSRKDQQGAAGLIMSHVVSLTPVETHVFASLTYKMGFYLGTPDGRAWKVDDGHIAGIDQDAAGFDGVAARMTAAQSEDCKMIVIKPGDKGTKPEIAGPTKVLIATEQKGKFDFTPPPGVKVAAIMCGRDNLLPAPNDYKVLAAGYTLTIVDNGTGHVQRMGTLELNDGRFQFRLFDGGHMTADEQTRVQARMNQFQQALQAESESKNASH